MNWLINNIGSIIILIVLIISTFFIIKAIKNNKGCDGDCSRCNGCKKRKS